MRNLGGVVTAVVVAGFLSAIPVKPSDAATRAFDGEWSVVIDTAYGNCGTYRAAIDIIGGQVVSPSQDYTAAGYVLANGQTAVSVRSSAGLATGYGRLRGSTGAGQWRSESGECTGTWTAYRRS